MKKTVAAVIGTVSGAIGGLGAVMATDAILTHKSDKAGPVEVDEISRDASDIHGDDDEPNWAK